MADPRLRVFAELVALRSVDFAPLGLPELLLLRARDSLCLCTAKASQLNGQVVQLYKWVQHSKSCEFHEALMPVMWVCRQNRYIISHFQNGFHTSRPIMTYHILIDTKKYTNTICYHVVLVE